MWASDLIKSTKRMRELIRQMEKSAKRGESDEVEEIAREIESSAGAIVADMQTNGIFVGIRDASNDRIIEGDFGSRG